VRVFSSAGIRHLRNALGMESFHLCWVPHKLTPGLRRRRLKICGQPLPILEARELSSFRMSVAGEESWFVSEYQHSTKWSMARDKVTVRASEKSSTQKVMLRVIWGINRRHVVDMMPPRGRFNIEYFLIHVLDPLLPKVFPEGRKSHTLRLCVHLDNCRVRLSKRQDNFDENSLVTAPDSPSRPD
jgi:hypothetical protein